MRWTNKSLQRDSEQHRSNIISQRVTHQIATGINQIATGINQISSNMRYQTLEQDDSCLGPSGAGMQHLSCGQCCPSSAGLHPAVGQTYAENMRTLHTLCKALQVCPAANTPQNSPRTKDYTCCASWTEGAIPLLTAGACVFAAGFGWFDQQRVRIYFPDGTTFAACPT